MLQLCKISWDMLAVENALNLCKSFLYGANAEIVQGVFYFLLFSKSFKTNYCGANTRQIIVILLIY